MAKTRAQSEIELNEARVVLAKAEAQKAKLEAYELEVAKRKHLASNDEFRIYPFNGTVSQGSADACISYLGQWFREDPKKSIKIVFNSPGGGVIPGLALFDFITTLRDQGTKIDTESIGWAASMGGILLQAGETRSLGKHAYMLIHEVSAGAIGSVSEMEDELKFTKRLQSRILDILADRSTMSKSQIRRKWKKTDWWLDATEALKYGFIDEIT